MLVGGVLAVVKLGVEPGVEPEVKLGVKLGVKLWVEGVSDWRIIPDGGDGGNNGGADICE